VLTSFNSCIARSMGNSEPFSTVLNNFTLPMDDTIAVVIESGIFFIIN
jgi:hypothetical protein